MKSLSIKEIEKKFIELNILQFDQMQLLKAGEANKTYDKIYKLSVQIRKLSDRGEKLLRGLIGHAHPNVRATAAYLMLPLDSRLALNVFNELSKCGIIWLAIDAEMCIKEWKAGRLDVEWFVKKYDKC